MELPPASGGDPHGCLNIAAVLTGWIPFNGTAGQLRWEDLGGLRMIQGNVNTDTIADLTIFVRAPGPVDANWFLL